MNTDTLLEKTNEQQTQPEEQNSPRLQYGTNINETEDSIEISTEIAGYNKENLEITVENQQLSISSKNESDSEDKERRLLHREFTTESFTRTFRLSDRVDTENISAEARDGVLRITLPKHPKAQKRQIEVKAV